MVVSGPTAIGATCATTAATFVAFGNQRGFQNGHDGGMVVVAIVSKCTTALLGTAIVIVVILKQVPKRECTALIVIVTAKAFQPSWND